MYATLAILALFAFLYGAVADRLEKTPFSGPLVFLAFGIAAGPLGFGLLDSGSAARGFGSQRS